MHLKVLILYKSLLLLLLLLLHFLTRLHFIQYAYSSVMLMASFRNNVLEAVQVARGCLVSCDCRKRGKIGIMRYQRYPEICCMPRERAA